MFGEHLFTEEPSLREHVIRIMKDRPGLKEHGGIAQRIIDKIKSFLETFIDGFD